MKIIRAVGIDLGTTNSAVGIMAPHGNDIWLFEDRFKRKTLPSMLGWDPDREQFITGWEAWNRRVMEPAPIASVKRKMGLTQPLTVGPHQMTPEKVSGKILERLVQELSTFLETKHADQEDTYLVNRAVITVPAYFDAPQIEATRQAGELANLEVVGLLQEPTSAAMYYAWKHGIGDGTFMVYDLGGGTFDVSIIRCMLGEYQVLGIDGDNFLGGDDFDRKLALHIADRLTTQGYDLDLDVTRSQEEAAKFKLLTKLAQEIKEALSHSEVQYVGRRHIFDDLSGNSVSIDMEIARTDFEEIISTLIDASIACCESALLKSVESAGVGLQDIDHVLLVGGSTRVPLVQERIANAFCGPNKSKGAHPLVDEPDTCVALGAAIHAANLAGLTFINEEMQASVTITSSLSTKRKDGRLFGRLNSEENSEKNKLIESIVLLNASGDIAAISRPDEDDQGQLLFALEDVPLHKEGVHEFSLEFCDNEGDALAAFDVSMMRLAQSEQLRSTGSALSNPTVLAKDIYLEVVRDNKVDRQLLLPSGSSLPTEGKFRFYTTDRSGAIILRLFQNRFPIKTIHIDVPKGLEVGSSMDLNLSVDETMTMVANGEVMGQSFWAQIEPPPARELKDWQEIEALLNRVELIANELWGNEARYFRERTAPMISGIRETARTDPDKLQVLVARLEEVVEDYHNRDKKLTPGYGRLMALLDAIKRVVYREDDQTKLGMKSEDWRTRLDQIEAQANEAFQAHNQNAWSRSFNQVQALWESLAQDEFRFMRGDTEEYVRRLYVSLLDGIQETRSKLSDFNYASNPETRALQEAEIRRLLGELKNKIEAPISKIDIDRLAHTQAKSELDRLFEAINHIERQYEKLPTIGLVRQ